MSFLRLMEEKLEENESANSGEAEAVSKPVAPKKKHTVTGLIKEMWPAYLIEIIVIILGISITLALEEWRDSSKEKHLENIYLKNLLADVEVDLNNLGAVSASTQKILKRGDELLEYIRNPAVKPISDSQVNADVRMILGRPKFLSQDATFSDLKSSGNLHLVKDIQLKNLLFDYYSQTTNIKEMQDAEQLATINLSGAYFLKNFQIDPSYPEPVSKSDKIKPLLNSFEFNNNVLLRVLNRGELLELYQKTDSLAIRLKAALLEKSRAD
jgi:hypothetical protein